MPSAPLSFLNWHRQADVQATALVSAPAVAMPPLKTNLKSRCALFPEVEVFLM